MIDYPASQHDGACGFAFVDGHSEMKKWLDRRTMPPLGPLLHLNVPMPNNVDLYWLMDHSTRRP
jgi:prepilin-type processing-associated H-X9-DG protein